jgi:hypothetical protein
VYDGYRLKAVGTYIMDIVVLGCDKVSTASGVVPDWWCQCCEYFKGVLEEAESDEGS